MSSRERRPVCRDFVALVTDYLDDALSADTRAGIDEHLEECPDCTRTLEQWRTVIALTGRLGEDAVHGVPPTTRARLLTAFRLPPAAPD